jgi:O-acetylhomoserine (thiol)-lyase
MTAKQLEAAGLAAGSIRLSIGLEHYQDLIDDLEQAFNA